MDANKELIQTVKIGDIIKVKEKIKEGATDYENAARWATKKGYVDILKLLMNITDIYPNNLAVYAAKNGHTDIIQLLLKKGADNYHHIMTNAARTGHKSIIKLMMEKDIDNCDYQIVLEIAVEFKHLDIVNMLLLRCDEKNINLAPIIEISIDNKFFFELIEKLNFEQLPKNTKKEIENCIIQIVNKSM